MTWNHRVIHRVVGGEDEYSIHECFYNPTGWTQNPIPVVSDSVEGLKQTLNWMMEALDKEVIEDS